MFDPSEEVGTGRGPGGPTPRVYGVSELTRLIKSILEREVGEVWLEGEISNLRQPASGHSYFTLKDETAQISAVFFRGNQRGLRFQPRDGLLVRVFGAISVYERSGNYQIIVRIMEEAGKGALHARFEALKAKLQKEGLFEAGRKKSLPSLPRHIGVVTSPTGAAIRDILNVITRRFPNVHVLVAPVRVQGEGAAEEIAAAVDLLNARGGLDVLIVGRGGGSLEDLWCFNEEVVARAIARSRIPVISAVGHETDFTISDFVADLRAPTPSAAAELVVNRKDDFEEALSQVARRLGRALRETVLTARNDLLTMARRHEVHEPTKTIARHQDRLAALGYRMGRETESRLREGQQRLDEAGLRMSHQVQIRVQARREQTRRLAMQLKTLDPLAVLGRGYSITQDDAGRVVRSVLQARRGLRLVTRVSDGTIASDVVGTV